MLDRLGALIASDDQQRIERMLAAARTFLAVTSLVAIWLDPTEPTRYSAIAYGLMALYVVHSLVVHILVLVRDRSTPAFRFTVHAVDILWPTLMAMVTEGPNSPFFVFNVFVLSAAAYRWGLQETLITAGAAIVLYTSEAFLLPSAQGFVPFYSGTGLELNRLIMRAFNLLIMGFLLGYLGEEEKLLRLEASATAGITGKIQAETGVRAAVQDVLDEVCPIFGSKHALIILNETTTQRLYLWEGHHLDANQPVQVSVTELVSIQRAKYIFDTPAQAWHAVLRAGPGGQKNLHIVALDEAGQRQRGATWSPAEAFLEAHNFREVLGVSFASGTDWTGTMLLFDPDLGSTRTAAVSFLLTLSRYVGPALYNLYLTRTLRSRAGAVERARVARELHDGIIQSLISIEMQMDVLRRQEGASPDQLAAELHRIQLLLRQEVLNLRELMQQMMPVDIGPKQLLDFLAYTVDKFRRDTGIAAAFTSALEEVHLPQRVSVEVARILQEALVNIRKHSGAKNVLVRFDSVDGNLKLIVDDDGRGFGFSGRLTQNDLDSARRGPVVIKERVRSLGGELTIDSGPGRGARLEISFPQKNYV
jgi:signal transduction histidine kinase